MDKIEIQIMEAYKLVNGKDGLKRMHYQAYKRYRDGWAWKIRAGYGTENKPPIKKCLIVVKRFSANLPDWDGLYGGVKPLLDCLNRPSKSNPSGLGIIWDDSPRNLIDLKCIPVRAPRGQGKTIIEILKLPDDTPSIWERED